MNCPTQAKTGLEWATGPALIRRASAGASKESIYRHRHQPVDTPTVGCPSHS